MAKITQYAQALKAKLNDLFAIAQDDDGTRSTKSVTVSQIGDAIITEETFTGLGGLTPQAAINENKDNVGDLSQLSTSIQSSLVGAVNEVNGKTKPTSVTPTFNSSQSNYSIPFNNTRVYKIGNIVYFTSTIQPDTPYNSSPGQEVYSGLPKPYSNDSIYMGFCAWNVTTNNMRAIVTSDGKLLCRGGNTGTAYDVAFSYVCQ